jgi:phosphatidylserine/phosphatidylglycerophosphate/cardiolipin synthase-like enzyme
MKRMRILISLFLVFTLLGCVANADPLTKVKSAEVEWAFTQADQHPEKVLVSLIDSAKTTLDIAIYSLTYPDIVGAIKKAKQRGVSIRLISDKIQASGKSQTEALKILGSAGIPLKINSHSGLMHLKMTIVDHKIATTGSFNYSAAASTDNDEVFMILRNEEIAKAFTEQFDAMWNDTNKFQVLKTGIALVPEATIAPVAPTAPCTNPTVKGNSDSKIYHVPGGVYYKQTLKHEIMFCTEKDAQAAGYVKSKK